MPHFPLRLRFVSSTNEGYSIYAAQGVEHYIQDGTGKTLVSFDDLDILREWNAYTLTLRGTLSSPDPTDFTNLIAAKIINPDDADDIRFCDDCEEPDDADELTWTQDRTTVCEGCLSSNYFGCPDCETYANDDSGIDTLNDETVCRSCLENHYYYCDHCDGYRHEYDDDHYHDDEEGCERDCVALAQDFKIANGSELLANDERASVSLAAGIVTDEGMGAISALIRRSGPSVDYSDQYEHDADGNPIRDTENGGFLRTPGFAEAQKWTQLSYDFGNEIGNEWQSKAGNFTKRLSRYAYKTYGIKLPNELVSEVGNIGSAHSGGVDVSIEVTRDLNLPAYDFGHEDSCWWQSYYESRCTLKSNGGFGLRSFDPNVSGRAWVLPLKSDAEGNLTSTSKTIGADAFFVFNGYGDLSGYKAARVMAQMTGMTYRKVEFNSGSPMYVNNDNGYLIAPESIAANYTDGTLTLRLAVHESTHEFDNEMEYANA